MVKISVKKIANYQNAVKLKELALNEMWKYILQKLFEIEKGIRQD